ncbi:MAG: HD domain-containing protein, partial [Patescibacteria group bacterium]
MKSLAQIQKNLAKILKAEKGLPAGRHGLNFIAVLSKKFPQAKIYLVGGMARDLFLGRESKDYDFVVCGVPAKKLETILKKLGATNLVGKRFGVFKFAPTLPPPLTLPLGQGEKTIEIDIALPRTEHAWGTGGYRDVETQSDWRLPIEKDLARRDFTINAMALELGIRNKELGIMDLTDPFDGLSDLKKKLIRTVGKPEERFKEDFSRMLRGLRFASQLNFQIEKNTWDTLVKMMKKINATLCHSRPRSVIPANAGIQSRAGSRGNPAAGSRIKCGMTTSERIVPYEVISKEFLKSLVINPLKTVDLWDEAGALKQLMPELLKMQGCPQPPEFHKEGDVWTHTYLALGNLFAPHFKKFVRSLPPSFQNEPLISPTLVLAVLFHDLGKPYTIKTPEKDGVDRIRTNEHDSVGAKLAKQIGERLRLSSVPDMHCNLDHLAWLIQHHLLTVHGDPMKFTNRTIEKYFFNPLVPGTDLLKLIYC